MTARQSDHTPRPNHSTGPRTPEGMSRCRLNARSHGFTASTFAVVPQEVPGTVRPRADGPNPAGDAPAPPAGKSGLFTNCLDLALNDNGTAIAPMSRGARRRWPTCRSISKSPASRTATMLWPKVFIAWPGSPHNTWSLFCAIRPRPKRHYRRAVEEFNRLKALRAKLPNEPILEVQPEESEPSYAPPDKPISTRQPNPQSPVDSVSTTTSSKPSQPAAIFVGQAPWPGADPSGRPF
jgi:hypothetical protein